MKLEKENQKNNLRPGKIRKFFLFAKDVQMKKGYSYLLLVGIKRVIELLYYKIFKSKRTFIFQKTVYHYFYHLYNGTWSNERSVEIPIIWKILQQNKNKKILEIGNVLSHYFNINHDVLDKYEKAPNVINEDIVNFNPVTKYDLIVSISTFEHIGWDEAPREPKKVYHSIEKVKKILNKNGMAIITIPFGYNLDMDQLLLAKIIKFSKQYYLKKISQNNDWVEVDWDSIKETKFNYPYSYANGLIIGIIERQME